MSMRGIGAMLGVTRAAVKARLDEYGIPTRYSGWQHKAFPCQDGHIVKSTYELRVDNWLFENDVLHVYEIPLTIYGGTGSADFLIDDTFVEVWGVTNSDSYSARRKIKLTWYEVRGISLVSINHWDFAAQKKDLWKRKLENAFL